LVFDREIGVIVIGIRIIERFFVVVMSRFGYRQQHKVVKAVLGEYWPQGQPRHTRERARRGNWRG
jgi:hypothetical protein